MFSRFTDHARIVIAQALKAAEGFRHDHIGPEHLLLGLGSDHAGVAATALTSLGVSQEMIRREMERLVVVGARGGGLGPLPFTPQAKHALERASEEAHDLGHPYIGTEHIMLGIISDGASVATRVLSNLGISAERCRAAILELLRQRIAPPESEPIGRLIMMTGAAKSFIGDAIERMSGDGHLFPALGMTTGFATGSRGDGNHLEHRGTCFGIQGHADIGPGWFPIGILGRKVLVHDAILEELDGKVLDAITVVNVDNGAEMQVLKAIHPA